jgi:uncharacterized protein
MNTLRLADCPETPWRNGGGRTRELLAWPRADEWQVRVSVARIEANGPFSAFPGIDRFFAVLGGAGVVLGLTRGDVRLHRGDPALAFPGEAAPLCRLIDGPTRDLNLMLRRGAHGPWRGLYADDTLWWSDEVDEVLPQRAGWRLSMRGMEYVAP